MSKAVETTRPAPAAPTSETVTDSLGRVLTITRLDALSELDLVEAVGGVNAENRRYMVIATIAACVRAIDGVPTQPLHTRESVRSLVRLVGSEGIAAVMAKLTPDELATAEPDLVDAAGN